jgi:hypothetical protein
VWTAAFGNGVANTLLGAREYISHAASTATITTLATAATVACGVTAPNQRNYAQRADTYESE